MITGEQFSRLSSELYDYDVRDNAWEHEPYGFEVNAKHTLTHLAKDLVLKDFRNETTVARDIAPDLLQYSIRLMRWSGQSPREAIRVRSSRFTVEAQLRGYEQRYPGISTGSAAVIGTIGIMAKNLHDHDHVSTRNAAIDGQSSMALRAASLLIAGTESMADDFSFDIEQSFTARIVSLRERFSIIPAHA